MKKFFLLSLAIIAIKCIFAIPAIGYSEERIYEAFQDSSNFNSSVPANFKVYRTSRNKIYAPPTWIRDDKLLIEIEKKCNAINIGKKINIRVYQKEPNSYYFKNFLLVGDLNFEYLIAEKLSDSEIKIVEERFQEASTSLAFTGFVYFMLLLAIAFIIGTVRNVNIIANRI